MIFYGIADAHGIESFEASQMDVSLERFQMNPSTLAIMMLRANANRHRHAVVYQADLAGKDAMEIYKMLENGEYPEALVKLKECAKSISLAKSPGSEKSWKLIPNPDLDPYS